MGFEMSPHVFDRIQLRRVGRQALHHHPPLGGGDILLDQAAAMNRRAVPQHHQFSGNVPLEVAEKLDNLKAFDAASVDLKVEAPQGQPADDREALPVEGFLEHRRLPARSPGPGPRRAGA